MLHFGRCGSEAYVGVMQINQPAAKSSLWTTSTVTGHLEEHL